MAACLQRVRFDIPDKVTILTIMYTLFSDVGAGDAGIAVASPSKFFYQNFG